MGATGRARPRSTCGSNQHGSRSWNGKIGWNTQRWNGPTGSIIGGCWNRLATSRQRSSKRRIISQRISCPWQHDSNPALSRKTGAVQSGPAPRRRSLESLVLLDFRRSFNYLLAPDQVLALRFPIASKLTMPTSPTMGGSNAYRALEALRSNSSTLLFPRVRKCPAYPVRPNRTRTSTCRSTGAI